MNDMQDLKIVSTEQLMQDLEEAQDRIEELEKGQEDYDQLKTANSKLSSQNKELKGQVQEDGREIARLNERIEKLSDSDLILQRAENIRKEAEAQKSANEVREKELEDKEARMEQDCSDYKASCVRMVGQIKNQCARDNNEAARRLERAETYEEETRQLRDNEIENIRQKAESITTQEIARLRKKADDSLKAKASFLTARYAVGKYSGRFMFVMVFLHSLMFGIFSKRLRDDFLSIWTAVSGACNVAYHTMISWVENAEKWFGTTKYFHWLGVPVHILIYLIPMAVVAVVIVFLVKHYIRFLGDEEQFDDICKWIMAGSLFLCISVSKIEPPIWNDMNLILVWVLIQATIALVKILLKWIVEHKDQIRRVEWKPIIVNVVAVLFILIAVIGWIYLMRAGMNG